MPPDIKNMSQDELYDALCRSFNLNNNQTIRDMCRVKGIDPAPFLEQKITWRAAMDFIESEKANGQRLPSDPRNTMPAGSVSLGLDEKEKFRAAASDAILTRAGIEIEQPAHGYDELVGFALADIAREYLRVAGQPHKGYPYEVVGRALTTSDFPNILENVANKSLLLGYKEAEETWRDWCSVHSAKDFKQISVTQLSEAPNLEGLNDHGEFRHGYLADSKETTQLETTGLIIPLTRHAIVNDDLDAFTDIPKMQGAAASRKVGDYVASVLTTNAAMGDGIVLFHADHSNLQTAAALSVAALGIMIAAMKKQKGLLNQARLSIRPKFFIAPAALEGTAEEFFLSKLIGTQAEPNKVNPYSGPYFTRVYDPRLDDDSETAYYLAGPKGMAVRVYFLGGNDKPYLESKTGWSIDGVEYKVRLDAIAKAADWRALQKNPGSSS